MRSLRSLVQRARALAEGSLWVGMRQRVLCLSPHLAFQFSAWEAGSRSGRALLFWGPLGMPGDQAFAHSAHHPMAQTSFFLINSKQENICLQCVSCSVSFHLDENKALWWLQQKWHRTLRKLKNFGNWYVRDFLLIIKGYLRGSKGFYNCSIIFDKSVCLKCKWRFFCQSCTQMYFYLLWISRSYLGYGFLRLEDRLTD